jgi:hypothetical protein
MTPLQPVSFPGRASWHAYCFAYPVKGEDDENPVMDFGSPVGLPFLGP